MRDENFSFFAREHTKMRAGRVEYGRPHSKMRAKQIKGENARKTQNYCILYASIKQRDARTKPKLHILIKRRVILKCAQDANTHLE